MLRRGRADLLRCSGRKPIALQRRGSGAPRQLGSSPELLVFISPGVLSGRFPAVCFGLWIFFYAGSSRNRHFSAMESL